MRAVGWKNLLSGSKLLPGASLRVLRTAQRARQVKDVGGLGRGLYTAYEGTTTVHVGAYCVGGGGGAGGGGVTDSLSLGIATAKLQPPLLDKRQPLFCYLQIYSPLFSYMTRDNSLKSTLNDEFSILNIYQIRF